LNGNYLPAFELKDEYITANMTIRDLVKHRSGLPRHDLLWYGSPLKRKEIFDRFRYLDFSAGFSEKY
jgi:CubicO group peptidase (beta-lactamase class C family)